MNFKIPLWLHVSLSCALAVAGVVTTAVSSGQLQIAAPIMTIVSMLALVVHSVDPTAAGAK
jgi:hypothetical protein